MQFEEALDILTNNPSVQVTSEKLLEATNCLQSVCDDVAIPALATISFDTAQESSRREAALVLLRARVLVWTPPAESPIKTFIEEGLAKALIDVQSPQLIWRIASVISALISSVDETGNHQWSRLVESVSTHLGSERVLQSPELLYGALELTKAIFSDGIPMSLMANPPPFIESLFIAGLTSETPEVQRVAFPALGSTLEAYVQKRETPTKCRDLFVHMVSYLAKKLNDPQMTDWEQCVRLLTNVVSVVDVSGPLRMVKVDIWNAQSAQIFTDLLVQSPIDNWGPRAGVMGTKIVHQLCRIAAACAVGNSKQDTIVKVCWDYIIHHLTYLHMGRTEEDLEQIITQWELRRDDDESVSDLELPDGSDDLPAVAWELLDRVISTLDGKTAKTLVSLTAPVLFKATVDRAGCGKLYAAWMLLAIFIGSKADEMLTEEIKVGLNHWKGIVKLRTEANGFDAYACARVRWAALLFMNEALEHFSEILTHSQEYIQEIIAFAHIEKVPRVKAKCYLALCQFTTSLEDQDDDQDETAAPHYAILSQTFQQWLLPQLDFDSMLQTCESTIKKPYTYDEEGMSMEIYLRELTMCSISSCLPHLGRLLPSYYQPIITYCKGLLSKVMEDPLSDYVAEAVLDLFSRAVECAGIFDSTSPEEMKKVESSTEDAIFLLRSILRIHRALETHDNLHQRCLYKTGIYAQGFERTLLQAAARALSVAPITLVRSELSDILNIVVGKLESNETITISDRVTAGPGVGKSIITHDGKTATLILNETRGKQKTININTAAVEEQIGCLSFVGVTADRIWEHLTKAEKNKVVGAVFGTVKGSPFGLVRKAGVEAWKEVVESVGLRMLRRAKQLDISFNDNYGVNPETLLADDEFVTTFQYYLLRLQMGLELGTNALKQGEGAEDAAILYALGDMCNPAKELAIFLGVSIVALGQAVPSVTQFGDAMHSLFAKIGSLLTQDTNTPTEGELNLDDDDEEEETDAFGLRCDATMQVICRLARAFGQQMVPAFEEHLKAFFATILVTEDISIVARTAALCIFGNYLEINGPSMLSSDLVPVALVFTRPRPIDSPHLQLFRTHIPQLAVGRPSPDVNENTLEDLAQALRETAGGDQYAGMTTAEVNSSVLDDYQPEVMKIQAACFCVGAAVANLTDQRVLSRSMPVIDEAFAALMDHPLAALASRRVILDCLGCAFLKILDRWGVSVLDDSLKVFNKSRGISTMLSLLFPLVDDHEDACHAHNVLLKWSVVQPPPGFPKMLTGENTSATNGTDTSLGMEEAGKIRNELKRIFQELRADPENEDLLSDWGVRYALPRI